MGMGGAIATATPLATAAIGRIVGLDPDGRPLVALAGQAGEPRPARSVVQVDRAAARTLAALPAVLLLFDDGDCRRPIIVGWLHDTLVASPAAPLLQVNAPAEAAVVDGARVTLRAEQEIELVCGASSILLRKDGHVVIKGVQVVSRASGANKIKGATVAIN